MNAGDNEGRDREQNEQVAEMEKKVAAPFLSPLRGVSDLREADIFGCRINPRKSITGNKMIDIPAPLRLIAAIF